MSKEVRLIGYPCAGCIEAPNGVYVLFRWDEDGKNDYCLGYVTKEEFHHYQEQGRVVDTRSSDACPGCFAVGCNESLEELKVRFPDWEHGITLYQRYLAKKANGKL